MSTSNINDYCFPSFDANEIKEAFDCFDINKNGYISVNELKEIFNIIGEDVTNEELDEMIAIADKEGDGQVNWLNFYEFLTGNAMDKEIKQLVLGMNEISQHEHEEGNGNSKSNVKLTVNIHEHMQSLKDDETIGMRDKHEKEVFDNIIHSINYTNSKNNNDDGVKKEKDNEYELDASKDLLLDNNTGANNNNINNNNNNNNIRKLTSNVNAKDESQNNILLLLKKKNLLNNN